MNWQQLFLWAFDPARTPAEIRQALEGLGLSINGTDDDQKTRLLAHSSSQADLTAASGWTPAGWVPPTPVLATPVIPPPAPAPPVRGGRGIGVLIGTAVVAAAAIGAIWLATSGGSDNGVKTVTTTPATTASASTANTALLTDPRVAGIIAQIQSGQIKTIEDLRTAAAKAGFGQDDRNQIEGALKGTLSGQGTNGNQGQTTTQATKCPGDRDVKVGETYDVPAGCNVKGDVSVFENGTFVNKFDNDPATGLIISCPSGCKIKAPYSANASPRTVPDLKSEMEKSGCGNGCKSVKVIIIGDAPKTASSGGGKSSVPSVSTGCGPGLKPGDVQVLSAGCIVVGDVFARRSSNDPWTWTTDSQQNTGSVQKLSSNFEIRAPFGAAVYDSSYNVASLADTTKELGCHTGNGCTGGVSGWNKTP